MLKHWFILFSLSFLCDIIAQKDSIVVFEGNKDKFFNIKPETTQTTKVITSNMDDVDIDEAPSTITLITAEMIKTRGYKDLLEILNSVPDFYIGIDVQNAISVGIRGIWAEEGRLLFLLDGISMNEIAFGTFVLGNHLDVHDVERIEIVRGPGSVIFGGVAACGVINIRTRNAKEFKGAELVVSSSASNFAYANSSSMFSYGNQLVNGLNIKFSGSLQQGHRSNTSYILTDSIPVNFKDSSNVFNIGYKIALNYKGFTLQNIFDQYDWQSTRTNTSSLNRLFITELKYTTKIKRIELNAVLTANSQIPWITDRGSATLLEQTDILANRGKAAFLGKTKLLKNNRLNIRFGGEAWLDAFKPNKNTATLANGNKRGQYTGIAAFGEISYNSKFVHIFAGARLDNYATFSTQFNPRIGLTKRFKKWHYKILGNQASKIPTLQNINLQGDDPVMPEQIKSFEVELGFHRDNLDVVFSVYDFDLDKYIVFKQSNVTLSEGYSPGGRLASRGFDFIYNYRFNYFRFSGSYSTFFVNTITEPEASPDSLKTNRFLSAPTNKLVTNVSYSLPSNFSISLNYIFESPRLGFIPIYSNIVLYKTAPHHIMNFAITKEALWKSKSSFTVGVKNAFNLNNFYLYPGATGYYPMPSMGREIFATFRLNFE
jgi:outer membrane receptor protein involved in Fe transport